MSCEFHLNKKNATEETLFDIAIVPILNMC